MSLYFPKTPKFQPTNCPLGPFSSWQMLCLKSFSQAVKACLVFFVAVYRTIGTSFLGGQCRFEPSCSDYARQCLHHHGPWVAVKLIAIRLSRCRPGGGCGYDPVPLHLSGENK